MRVGIYARVSTSDKDQDPETQLLPLREFVAAHPDWTIAGEYVDHASATDLKGRKAWRQLLESASRRGVDLIVCWRLDRCFRSTLHAAETLEKLRHWGIGLRSLMEAWADSTSPAGELMFTIATAFAAFERSLIRERVKAGMDRARRQGRRLGRPPVLNGEWEETKLAIKAGTLSQRQAARQLQVARSTIYRMMARNGGGKYTPPARTQ